MDGGRPLSVAVDGVGTERAAAPAKFEPAEKIGRLKLFLVRALNYVTNHVISHIPGSDHAAE